MPKVSDIYISLVIYIGSLVIYIGNYRFRVFGPCTSFQIKFLAVNSLWHKKITWFIPKLFEYLWKSFAQGGLVWMLWSGLVFWLWWGQVWRLWWDIVGVGEEISVGKETLLPNNHVLYHVPGLSLWFYWIYSYYFSYWL